MIASETRENLPRTAPCFTRPSNGKIDRTQSRSAHFSRRRSRRAERAFWARKLEANKEEYHNNQGDCQEKKNDERFLEKASFRCVLFTQFNRAERADSQPRAHIIQSNIPKSMRLYPHSKRLYCCPSRPAEVRRSLADQPGRIASYP